MSNQVYIGELNVKIEIFGYTEVSSATGEPQKTPVVYKRCWAKEDVQNVTEDEEGKIRMLDVRSYIVRFDKNLIGVAASEKFIKDQYGNAYNIHGSLPIGRKRYLRLKCSRRE